MSYDNRNFNNQNDYNYDQSQTNDINNNNNVNQYEDANFNNQPVADNNTNNQQANVQDEQPEKKEGFAVCCKKASKFIFSHIGLVAMVVIYAIAGAFLFELLEQHREAKDCQEGKGEEATNIVNLKSKLLSYIQFNITTNPMDTSKDNETVANTNIELWLTNFRDQVLDVKTSYRYYGQDCKSYKWNFAGSLLFAITIITTIGYGHITPVTWEGQIVCICYATIGIPLFLMCIANISGVLGDMFRFLYARVCCRLCLKKKPKQGGKPEDAAANATDLNNNTGQAETQFDNNAEGDMNKRAKSAATADGAAPATVVDEEEEEDDEDEKVTVPLTITMIIITLYILIGAVLFHFFEGWTLVEAGYFCYITLATIGFGDFVPGQKEGDPMAGAKLIVGAIYVLFGMAILAMCFDLMQEEIIAKFTWLGKKVGIVEKDEEEKAEDEKEEQEKKEKESAEKQKEAETQKLGREKSGFGGADSSYNETNRYGDSPAPSYSATNTTEEERMARIRSAYFKNLNRQ